MILPEKEVLLVVLNNLNQKWNPDTYNKKEARPFDGEHKTGFFEIIILVIFGCLAILGTIALVFGLLVGLNIDTHFPCGGFLCSYYIIFAAL